MMFTTQALCSLLLCVLASQAHPSEPPPSALDPRIRPLDLTPANYPGEPQWACFHHDTAFFDAYTFEARNWNLTEQEVKETVKVGTLTGWRWSETDDDDGAQRFRAKWRLPIWTIPSVEHSLSQKLDPENWTTTDGKSRVICR